MPPPPGRTSRLPRFGEANWAREIDQAIPAPRRRRRRRRRSALAAEWTIVNYDILSKRVAALGRVPWAGFVFDEAHYLKNHTSARSKLARQLAEDAATNAKQEPAVSLLTGTPLTNRPRDLFVLLQLVGHSLGRKFPLVCEALVRRREDRLRLENRRGVEPRGAAVQLHGVMLRRSKNQVLTLPPKLRTWLPVDVPAGPRPRNPGGGGPAPRRSRQRAGGATPGRAAPGRLLAMLTKARRKLAAAKVGATGESVSGAIDQGEKVIVFSCFDEPLQ